MLICATAETITCFNLSTGSVLIAALFIDIGLAMAIEAAAYKIDTGHMHFIGKLMLVKLKSPLRTFLPIFLRISLPADLSFDDTFLSSN